MVLSQRDLLKILEDAANEGVIECPECGNSLEPDAEKCACGWINPLVKLGYI